MPDLKLVHVTTVPQSLMFLRGQVGYMQRVGLEVMVISSPGALLERFSVTEGISMAAVQMPRQITPLRDLRSIWSLGRIFRRLRPAIVHAHTPKAGLLAAIAAKLVGSPIFIYGMLGLPYMTAMGTRRAILKTTERISCLLADEVLCVSPSLRDVAIADRICRPDKIKVLAGGSINGVDALGNFNPDRFSSTDRMRIRETWGVTSEALVIGFVGRVVRDKGIVELASAWHQIRERFPSTHLLVVGPIEPEDPVPSEVLTDLETDPRVHFTGSVSDTAQLYAGMDLVVLPTYREGLPTVPLEAAAMRLPVMATRIPGCVDAVADGVTGMLVPPRDAVALAEAIARYLADLDLRRRHGHAGRERALREFRQEVIWDAIYQEYVRLLTQKGLPVPQPGASEDGKI